MAKGMKGFQGKTYWKIPTQFSQTKKSVGEELWTVLFRQADIISFRVIEPGINYTYKL